LGQPDLPDAAILENHVAAALDDFSHIETVGKLDAVAVPAAARKLGGDGLSLGRRLFRQEQDESCQQREQADRLHGTTLQKVSRRRLAPILRVRSEE
jgi:hypothetical protein